MDIGLCVHSSAHRQGLCGSLLNHRGWNNDSRSQQTGGGVHHHDWHTCTFVHSQVVLTFPPGRNSPAGPARGVRNHSKKVRQGGDSSPICNHVGLLHFSTSGEGTLEGGVSLILPGEGSKHQGMYAQNKTCGSKCRGMIWHLCACPDV